MFVYRLDARVTTMTRGSFKFIEVRYLLVTCAVHPRFAQGNVKLFYDHRDRFPSSVLTFLRGYLNFNSSLLLLTEAIRIAFGLLSFLVKEYFDRIQNIVHLILK